MGAHLQKALNLELSQASTRLTVAQERKNQLRSRLIQLQEFFARGGRERPLVPIKERSLDIFTDEKRLDQLMRGSALFGEGRLALETLRCFIVSEPLPWTAGPNPAGPILVVENAATWDSYRRWNAERKLFGAVVYGCGNRFVEGIRSRPAPGAGICWLGISSEQEWSGLNAQGQEGCDDEIPNGMASETHGDCRD